MLGGKRKKKWRRGFFALAAILAFLYGGAMMLLFAHAIGKQQIVLQEGE